MNVLTELGTSSERSIIAPHTRFWAVTAELCQASNAVEYLNRADIKVLYIPYIVYGWSIFGCQIIGRF